jgi:hypothetical protein
VPIGCGLNLLAQMLILYSASVPTFFVKYSEFQEPSDGVVFHKEAWHQFRFIACGIFAGQSANGLDFAASVPASDCQNYSTKRLCTWSHIESC